MSKKKIVLELTNAYGSAYCASEGERLDLTHIQIYSEYEPHPYEYSTEFACIMAAFIDFNDMYSILVKNFEQQDKYDTLVIKTDLMQYVKKTNTADQKKLLNDLCHAYKTIKMAGHRRPDEIYYQSDKGKIDEYCIRNLWEPTQGDVHECTYEFNQISEPEATE